MSLNKIQQVYVKIKIKNSVISINIFNKNQYNQLINIDWPGQSIKINHHSRIRLNVIDFR